MLPVGILGRDDRVIKTETRRLSERHGKRLRIRRRRIIAHVTATGEWLHDDQSAVLLPSLDSRFEVIITLLMVERAKTRNVGMPDVCGKAIGH